MNSIILAFALVFFGQQMRAAGADPQVKAGGVLLTMPAPAAGFVEAGDKLNTTLFELLVPSTNRLLIAYLPMDAIQDLQAGKTAGTMDVYAMAEVPRRAEYADCTPECFAQVLNGIGASMGKMLDQKKTDIEDELNLRLKSLDVTRIQIGQPQMLGAVFQKTDASGFAMLMAYKQGERTTTMAGGILFLRVKQRLIFCYLYRKYESPDTVTWVRKNLEAWADAILANNR